MAEEVCDPIIHANNQAHIQPQPQLVFINPAAQTTIKTHPKQLSLLVISMEISHSLLLRSLKMKLKYLIQITPSSKISFCFTPYLPL